jgi:hypothetical protein
MTTQEFSEEFDILYDNIRTNTARGLDEYEKSVFLTQAQEILVKGYYNNRLEGNEERRRELANLIKNYVSTSLVNSNDNISTGSLFFTIPEDLMYIISEKGKTVSTQSCYNNQLIDIIPVTHDEYNLQKKNPFRKPKLSGRTKSAWRIDYGDYLGQRVVEIIPPNEATLSEYRCRYLKKPRAIILETLTNESIDGQTQVSECELDSITHRDILRLAVRIAKQEIDMQAQQQPQE